MRTMGMIMAMLVLIGCDKSKEKSPTRTVGANGPGFSVSADRDQNEILIYVGESGAPYGNGDYDFDRRASTIMFDTWDGSTKKVFIELPARAENALILIELPSMPELLQIGAGAAERTIEAIKASPGDWRAISAVITDQVTNEAERARLVELLQSRIIRNAKI